MKISGKSHILEELERLKAIHGGSKVQSTLFQPDETQQRKLIIGNAATKIVSLSMKRECMKYVYHQKMKIEEEMRRNECQDGTESVNSEQTTETISHHAQHNAKKTNSGRGKSSQQRKKNGGSNRTYSSGIGSSTMIKFDISDRMLSKHIKPRVKSGGTLGRTTSLITTLSSNISTDDIIREIHQQAAEQLRDAKSIFECIVRSFDSGKICQFHPKRLFEDLDVSLYSTNTMSISNVTKLEDLSQMKKKDGILLIFDPSTDTQLHLATLKVSYMKSLDLNNEVEVSKEFTFWSNGNYYGLKFMREFVKSTKQSNRAYAPPLLNKGATPPRAFISRAVSSSSFVGDGVDEGSSSPVGSLSKANSQRYQSYNQSFAEEPTGDDFDQENTLLEDEDMNERSPNANLQAVYQFGGTDKCSLPGWNGRSALFIPAMKCRLEIINVKDLSRKAAVANNLSRLRLYGVCCPNPKVGIKKVLEFLEYQVLQDAANVTLPGGLSALNISAFHGNFEVGLSNLLFFTWKNYRLQHVGSSAVGFKWSRC